MKTSDHNIDFLKLGQPCENRFAALAQENPGLLMGWISIGSLTNAQVSFALEYLGNRADVDKKSISEFISGYLSHSSVLIREGAIYGISSSNIIDHMSKEAKQRIREIAAHDPSQGVRTAANDALEILNSI